MNNVSKKDHISFIIVFIIGIILILIFFNAINNNSEKMINLFEKNNSQCCECMVE